MKTTTISIEKASILRWKRERNTVCGNPVYRFTLADENGKIYRGKTRPNAGFVYSLHRSPDSLENVTVAITPTGRVYMDSAQENGK